jgi:hypothetical protein
MRTKGDGKGKPIEGSAKDKAGSLPRDTCTCGRVNKGGGA